MGTDQRDVPECDWLLTIPEAVATLRISRSHFFKLKRRGVIETIKLGSRTVVPLREITRLIDQALSSPNGTDLSGQPEPTSTSGANSRRQ